MDPDGVSPELKSDIEELGRRRADTAVGWATVEARNKRRNQVYGPIGIGSALGLFVAVTAAMVVPVYLSEHGGLAEHTLNWLVPVLMLGTMAVGAGLYSWWYVASGRPGRTAGTESSGPLDSAAVKEALADADREARRLRLARNAEPRLEYLRAMSQATGWTHVVIAALFTGPFLVGLALLSVHMARRPSPYGPGSWIWLLWVAPVAFTGTYVLLRRRPRRGRRAIEQGLARLAVYLDGRLLPSLADTVGWLNRYWAAPSGSGDYHTGPFHAGAAGTVLGYPVMVDFEPYGLSDDTVRYLPRTVIYLAGVPADETADVPSDRAGPLRSAHQRRRVHSGHRSRRRAHRTREAADRAAPARQPRGTRQPGATDQRPGRSCGRRGDRSRARGLTGTPFIRRPHPHHGTATATPVIMVGG